MAELQVRPNESSKDTKAHTKSPRPISMVNLAAASAALTACGGGVSSSTGGGGASSALSSSTASLSSASATSTSSNSSSSNSSTSKSSSSNSSSSAATLSDSQAAAFLLQAGFTAKDSEITQVKKLGYSGWLNTELQKPLGTPLVKQLADRGMGDIANKNNFAGLDNVIWKRLITGTDSLRLRVALALSEIIVIGTTLSGVRFRQFAMAYYWDILEANAFGNYRQLLEAISKSPAMGAYLTFRGSRKATGNNMPDENYAREIMQLFSIGLYELNDDGALLLHNGKPKETYTQTDVSQLARVFTGWDLDTSTGTNDTYDAVVRPMIQTAKYHETGTKNFLGTSIPANTTGEASLQITLDTLMAHKNIAPFISRQLIQRLVCSNPSPAYVARVSAIFNNNGQGIKGDLAAVIRAILTDEDARSDNRFSNSSAGKIREPMLRFIQWARQFNYTDPSDNWTIGDLSDPATRLGQSPLHSSSVFNFFRPGYTPTGTAIAQQTVPEFQITNESSIPGYINFMQNVISNGIASNKGNYADYISIASDSQLLLNKLNTQLAAGQVSATTIATCKAALDTISTSTAAGINNRIYAAVLFIMASPEYLIQK